MDPIISGHLGFNDLYVNPKRLASHQGIYYNAADQLFSHIVDNESVIP